MLSPCPDERPTPAEALAHEWFECDKEILSELLGANEYIGSVERRVTKKDSDGSFSSFKIGSSYFRPPKNPF